METPRNLTKRQEELLRELAEMDHGQGVAGTAELLQQVTRLLHAADSGERWQGPLTVRVARPEVLRSGYPSTTPSEYLGVVYPR